MADFKLTYFNVRGRAELVRLIFEKSGIQYEDERLTSDEWKNRKESTPLGQLPVLTYKGTKIVQSLTMARFVAKKGGLAGSDEMEEVYCDMFVCSLWLDILDKLVPIFFEKDEEKKASMIEPKQKSIEVMLQKLATLVKGDFVLGDAMSYADLSLLDLPPWLSKTIPELEIPEKLKAVITKVEADPKISNWIATRPDTSF